MTNLELEIFFFYVQSEEHSKGEVSEKSSPDFYANFFF